MVASLFAKPRQKRMRIYDFRIRRFLFAKKKNKKKPSFLKWSGLVLVVGVKFVALKFKTTSICDNQVCMWNCAEKNTVEPKQMTEAMDREKKCAATTIGWIRKTESTLWMQKMDLILLIIFYNEKGVKKNFEWQHSNPFAHNELANLFDGTHKAFRLLTMHKKKRRLFNRSRRLFFYPRMGKTTFFSAPLKFVMQML